MTISHRIVTVTPEIAADMMRHLPDTQRKTSASFVRSYAEELKSGQWRAHAQPIQIATDGTVIDGQHRLLAIIESGVPMECVIAEGVDPAAFAFIDIGRRRVAAQFIEGPNSHMVTLAAQLLIAYEKTGGTLTNAHHMVRRLDIESTLGYVVDHPEIVELAALSRAVYVGSRIHAGTHLALLARLAVGRYENRISEWCNALIGGDSLGAGDPRLALRNRWMREYRVLNGQGFLTKRWFMLVRTWNAFVNDESLKIIRPSSRPEILDDGHPEPDPETAVVDALLDAAYEADQGNS